MDIQHQYDATQGEFFIVDERQRKIAELSYFFVDAQTINATHTFAPERFYLVGVESILYSPATFTRTFRSKTIFRLK